MVANHGLFAVPTAVSVKTTPGKDFPEIVGVELGDVPENPDPCPECGAVNMRCIVPNDEPRFPGRVVCGECGHKWEYADPATVARYGFVGEKTPLGEGLLPKEWFADEPDEQRVEGFQISDGWEPPAFVPSEAGKVVDDDIPF